ncbi:ABC transporter permease [Nonomuraea rhodomycinica]|uniref:ABC transporter permease n=1 Tax=Nonomuraea rhodomycinica TaxID=1712872 RepID=A0A7Y6MAS2_9ACTN|nr:ABC transporter permease [Nonomuraea rhodomycinica]NUW40115.1 ABC transporter permease [Nonomuraea rhodomycinica]
MTMTATYRLGTRLFWQDRALLLSSVLTPVMIAIGLPLLMRHLRADSTAVATAQFQGTLSIILSITAFMNVAVALSARRDQLVLKRLRATTLTDGRILAGQIAATATQTVAVAAVCTVAVHLAAGVPYPANPLLYAAMVIAGSVVLATLGAAYTAAIPRAELAGAACMPVFLLSGIAAGAMGPIREVLPSWLGSVLDLLPTTAVVDAVRTGAAARPALLLAVWGVAGVVAIRFWFRWEPRRS